ncbi:MAG: hypothetical protein WDW38_006761 [Sanguina aurantia]
MCEVSGGAGSSSGGSSSSSSSTSHSSYMHISPPQHMTTPTVTTDLQLFCSLRKRMLLGGESAQSRLRAVGAVYDSWILKGSCKLPALHLTHQIGALTPLAHACISLHAGLHARTEAQGAAAFRQRQRAATPVHVYHGPASDAKYHCHSGR